MNWVGVGNREMRVRVLLVGFVGLKLYSGWRWVWCRVMMQRVMGS